MSFQFPYLGEPEQLHTSKSFVRSSFYKYNQQKTNTKPYKFLCDTKVLYIASKIYHVWVIELSVSRDKVFLMAIYAH